MSLDVQWMSLELFAGFFNSVRTHNFEERTKFWTRPDGNRTHVPMIRSPELHYYAKGAVVVCRRQPKWQWQKRAPNSGRRRSAFERERAMSRDQCHKLCIFPLTIWTEARGSHAPARNHFVLFLSFYLYNKHTKTAMLATSFKGCRGNIVINNIIRRVQSLCTWT